MEVFACEGFDVPLERVADRAGVGRGTLYRNFPDRIALSGAVMQAHLDELAAEIEGFGDRSDAFLLALQALARLTLATDALAKISMLGSVAPSLVDRFRAGAEPLFAEPLARAKAAGLVRDDFALADVSMAARMIAGGALDGRSPAAEGTDRAMQLLRRGLACRGASGRQDAPPQGELSQSD
jgi:AcrR family transcriptional regulator